MVGVALSSYLSSLLLPRRRHFRNCRRFFDVAVLKVPTVTGMAGVLFRILATVTAFAVSHRKTTDSNRDAWSYCSRSAGLFLKHPRNCHCLEVADRRSTSSHKHCGCPVQNLRNCHGLSCCRSQKCQIPWTTEPDTSTRQHRGLLNPIP